MNTFDSEHDEESVHHNNPNHLQDPDNATDIDAVLSFYDDDDDTIDRAQFDTIDITPPAPVFSHLSQTSNLSALDRSVILDDTASILRESMLSPKSHRDVEADRQRVKSGRKRRRGMSSVAKKKRRRSRLTKRQVERQKAYQRFKYEKSVDLSNEADADGSIEYLVRHRWNTVEMRRRLLRIAREREELRCKEAQDALDSERDKLWGMADESEAAVDSDHAVIATAAAATAAVESEGGDHSQSSGPNWNFLREGYVTMPSSQAKELPYYIYNILSDRKALGMDGGDGITSDSAKICASSDSNNFEEAEAEVRNRIENGSKVSMRRKKRHSNKKIIQWDDTHHNTFPLYFHQLHPRMDLRSFTPWNNTGQDDMVLLHGRLARRLWIRMIAGGVTRDTMKHCLPNRLMSNSMANNSDPVIKQEIESDMSESSQSSESGATVDIYGSSDYRSQFNQSTILDTGSVGNELDQNDELSDDPIHALMSLTHALPRYTHRNRFYLKVATELGGLRQLWEDEIRPNLKVLKPQLSCMELRELKSFLGVDGSIPFWCSDPAVSTDPTKLYKRMQKTRLKLIPRLRRLIRRAGGNLRVDSTTTVQEMSDSPDVIVNDAVDAKSQESTTLTAIDVTTTVNTPEIEATQDSIDTRPVNTEEADAVKTEEVIVGNNYMPELSGSLLGAMDEVHKSLALADKYTKVVHEADIDVTNVSVALSSFLNELTTSSAKNQTEMWSETIDEYLSFVESQSNPADMNLNRRDGKVPQCSSLAKTVMARQAYTANCGIKGRLRRHKSNVKTEEDEEYEVDDYHKEDYGSMQELQTIKQSGNDLIKRGKDYLLNENLQLFTPIHLTTGVAMLSEHLTPLSAEIISKPYSPDDSYARTPFDLISKTLACLEENDQLISSPTDAKSRWDARGKVIDQVLVNSWERAAVIFRKCVRENPHTVDNWIWYVGTLLGILCVSSGMRMTSKTQVKMDEYEYEDSFDASHNEARYQLDFYDEKRVYALSAVEDLIEVAEKEDCPVFHMGVSSMLEWGHVMNLLDGQSSRLGYDLSVSEVRRLHADHVSYLPHKVDCCDTSHSILLIHILDIQMGYCRLLSKHNQQSKNFISISRIGTRQLSQRSCWCY